MRPDRGVGGFILHGSLRHPAESERSKMKCVSDRELVKVLMAKNAELAAQVGANASNVDYLAMMSDVEIPATDEMEVQADE
jgi:hypothetical protein